MMASTLGSARPFIFIGMMLAIVAIPQIAFHLAQAFEIIPKHDLTWTSGEGEAGSASWREREEALRVEDGSFADPAAVFGAGINPNLVANLLTPGVITPFAGAEIARVAVMAPTRTTTVARFREAGAARQAATDFLTLAAGFVPDAGPDGSYTFRRAGGDAARVLVAGRTVFVFSAATEGELDEVVAASQALERVGLEPAADPVFSEANEFWLYRPWVLITIGVILGLFYVVAFFRGAVWAGTVPAAPGVEPVTPDELRKRILEINQLDVPFDVREEPDRERIVVTWREADPKWADRARAVGRRRTHRLLITLDPERHALRVADQFSQFDWNTGTNGASIRWSGGRGIALFQLDHRQFLRLEGDGKGGLTIAPSDEYRFDLQEIKAPFIETARQSGWDWRPNLWQGPRWLSWLTD